MNWFRTLFFPFYMRMSFIDHLQEKNRPIGVFTTTDQSLWIIDAAITLGDCVLGWISLLLSRGLQDRSSSSSSSSSSVVVKCGAAEKRGGDRQKQRRERERERGGEGERERERERPPGRIFLSTENRGDRSSSAPRTCGAPSSGSRSSSSGGGGGGGGAA